MVVLKRPLSYMVAIACGLIPSLVGSCGLGTIVGVAPGNTLYTITDIGRSELATFLKPADSFAA